MKRIFALVLSLVFLLSCLVLPAGAMFDPSPVYQVQAASAYIVNTDTNIIVYDKDSTKQVSAGGLTKYMTLAVLLTNYADQLDSTFQMPFAISDYVYNTNNADMRSNETFTYREAMYAMLTRNANEAATPSAERPVPRWRSCSSRPLPILSSFFQWKGRRRRPWARSRRTGRCRSREV